MLPEMFQMLTDFYCAEPAERLLHGVIGRVFQGDEFWEIIFR